MLSGPLTKTAVTRKLKVAKPIRRWQNDRNVVRYKRPIGGRLPCNEFNTKTCLFGVPS